MFAFVLKPVAERGLMKGEHIGVDGSPLEANGALRMRAPQHRDADREKNQNEGKATAKIRVPNQLGRMTRGPPQSRMRRHRRNVHLKSINRIAGNSKRFSTILARTA